MLESLTIFTTGGYVLYQYCAQPSLVKAHNSTIATVAATSSTIDLPPSSDPEVTDPTGAAVAYTNHLINSVLVEQFLVSEYSNISSSSSSSNSNVVPSVMNPNSNKNNHITDGMTLQWKQHTLSTCSSGSSASTSSTTSHNAATTCTIYVVAIYPDILFEGPRQYLKAWAEQLVLTTIEEYHTYYLSTFVRQQQQQQQQQQQREQSSLLLDGATTAAVNSTTTSTETARKINEYQPVLHRPDTTVFHTIFRILLAKSKTQKPPTAATATTATSSSPSTETTTTNKSTSPNNTTNTGTTEKTQRNWFDGKGTITEKAMAALDKSHMGTNPNSSTGNNNNSNSNDKTSAEDVQQLKAEQYERALRDARMAYLPNDQEINDIAVTETASTTTAATTTTTKLSSSSWLVGIFQQVMGTKVLTTTDLQKPIQTIVTKLQQKNVSLSVAQTIGTAIQEQLLGQTLNSFYTIQTAVQQALESILRTILIQSQSQQKGNSNKSTIDLLQNIIEKRNSQTSIWSSISSITSGGQTSPPRPYVITVMGINGIGKTTTIAKLAYYLQQKKLTPLLVAGDTFRSGAIEQLRIHADCLNVPFYQQGYSKDPSSVANAAIRYATEQQYDVVLIDTAGRMQNNVPLMKSLNKLMVENQPDYCIMVCEAIVGHDGINQFQMFQEALGNSRRVDAFILTKFDTIDTKVGACLTLTYECKTPVLFLGVGQKYHHLQPLQISTIIEGLFA
jgi:signal recognition particle receptor subunit alpha